jgi:hypothetical protein
MGRSLCLPRASSRPTQRAAPCEPTSVSERRAGSTVARLPISRGPSQRRRVRPPTFREARRVRSPRGATCSRSFARVTRGGVRRLSTMQEPQVGTARAAEAQSGLGPWRIGIRVGSHPNRSPEKSSIARRMPSAGPGARVGETAEITPVVGWNTATVLSPISLPAGTYWLAYLPSDNGLHFRRAGSGTLRRFSMAYAPLPSAFATQVVTEGDHFSFYATLSSSASSAPNAAPTLAAPAGASPSVIGAKTTSLSVQGADDGGEGALTYTWAAISPPAPVSFSANGTNAAKSSVCTFSGAGTYTLRVTVADAQGLTVASTVSVTVVQTPTSLALLPVSASVRRPSTQRRQRPEALTKAENCSAVQRSACSGIGDRHAPEYAILTQARKTPLTQRACTVAIEGADAAGAGEVPHPGHLPHPAPSPSCLVFKMPGWAKNGEHFNQISAFVGEAHRATSVRPRRAECQAARRTGRPKPSGHLRRGCSAGCGALLSVARRERCGGD